MELALDDEPILDLSSSTTTTTTTTTSIKGKRTKRLRGVSSSSSSDLSGSATEEDEDMANCLILLAQGGIITTTTTTTTTEKPEKVISKKLSSEGAIAGLNAYECKTCNKCFPSFQALGGHRASHKKPKILHLAHEKKPVIDEESIAKTVSVSTNVSNKPRVHECSICGSEFSSGQALGGHMRRHRPLNMPETSPEEEKKERTLLSLDLNLPAPPEDGTTTATAAATFPFGFSVSKLVDCHY